MLGLMMETPLLITSIMRFAESGHGSRNGPEGLREFCYPKSVAQRRFPMPRELWWFPRRGGRRLWKSFVRISARR